MTPPTPTGCRMDWRAPGGGRPRMAGDSREVRWRGVYEAKGREWAVREAPKESHKADAAYRNSITDVIIFSAIP